MDIIGRSLSAAAVIAVIIFLRRVMFPKLPKRILSAMWLIAAAKLLLPFDEVILTGSAASDAAVTEVTYAAAPSAPIIPDTVINVALAVPITGDKFFVSECIWLFGAAFVSAFFVLSHIRSRKFFSCAIPADYDIASLKNDFGIIRRIRLLISDRIDSPLTYGLFSPVIIIPKSMDLQDESVRNVLCHELAHIKRLDALFKPIIALCAAIHWFNPMVWVMFVLANRDAELACDETALRRGKAAPEDYAMTLIKAEESRCLHLGGNFPLAGSFAGGKLEERIRDVMTKKKSAFAGLSAAVISAAAAFTLNVIVTPYDLSAYSYFVTSDIAVEESPSVCAESSEISYSEVIVEDVPDNFYTDYAFEEIAEADYFISVVEDAASSEAEAVSTAAAATDRPPQGNYIVVYDYPTFAYAFTTTEKGGINSDTTVVIKFAYDGSEVSRQTRVTPMQSR